MNDSRLNRFRTFTNEVKKSKVMPDVDDITSIMEEGERNFGIITLQTGGCEESKEYKQALRQLREDIAALRYDAIPFRYGYNLYDRGTNRAFQGSNAFFIPDITLQDLLALGNTYGEEVVIFGRKDLIESYNVASGERAVSMSYTQWKLAAVTVMFFPGTFRG